MSKRAVFEEVGAASAASRAPIKAHAPARREARAAIAAWLWGLAGLVVLMVVVGGLTRLTDSGLSITVWDPVMGAIPPLSQADWDAAFALYKETTEFQVQNSWMTLADFKPIYWWEWGHRFLGRFIGVVWAVGLLAFLLTRTIPEGWTWRLVLPGALGGLQGGIGWWMVHGGLDDLDVPSYRLALHLGIAFVILMLLAWYAFKIRLDPVALLQARRQRLSGLAPLSGLIVAGVFLQILAGALVAGIDAGRYFVDWPLMQGNFLPPAPLVMEPMWRNLFENVGTVQFNHRMLGYVVFALAIWFAIKAMRSGRTRLRTLAWAMLGVMTAQVGLGIVTVKTASPLHIAIWHQAGAMVLVLLLLRMRFEALYPATQKIAGRASV
ncbi:MAG: COX15/CtaA family protein [Pseudomonadota bacterium]